MTSVTTRTNNSASRRTSDNDVQVRFLNGKCFKSTLEGWQWQCQNNVFWQLFPNTGTRDLEGPDVVMRALYRKVTDSTVGCTSLMCQLWASCFTYVPRVADEGLQAVSITEALPAPQLVAFRGFLLLQL